MTVDDDSIDNIVTSKLIEIRNSNKYFIGYFNEYIRPLVLALTKMGGYVKTFKEKIMNWYLRR